MRARHTPVCSASNGIARIPQYVLSFPAVAATSATRLSDPFVNSSVQDPVLSTIPTTIAVTSSASPTMSVVMIVTSTFIGALADGVTSGDSGVVDSRGEGVLTPDGIVTGPDGPVDVVGTTAGSGTQPVSTSNAVSNSTAPGLVRSRWAARVELQVTRHPPSYACGPVWRAHGQSRRARAGYYSPALFVIE